MNTYMRGFVILFVLLVLLSYLPPGKQYRKYIRFYAQLLMVLAALRPLFVLFGGKDTFYEKMAYAQCMEKLSGIFPRYAENRLSESGQIPHRV